MSNFLRCFQIKAGETHPIYITDNINGGGEDADIIYGGSDSDAGTIANPLTFYWTPNMCAPLDYYYYYTPIQATVGLGASPLDWMVEFQGSHVRVSEVPVPGQL